MKRFYLFVLFIALNFSTLSAAYTTVYSINTNGGLAFTGNTLGLNKTSNQNNPGTSGSLGAFITLNTGLSVGSYPNGTTLDWTLNESSAVLDLPSGSTVLHAELVWSGSYGFDPAVTNDDDLGNTGATTNSNVNLTSPDSTTHIITPTLALSRVQAGSTGFYVRSADVTSIISSNGAGIYSVGSVPGTAIASENNLNCAGWTLCVAYANPNMLTSNLTIFVGVEPSGGSPAIATGFHAPDVGSIIGRLFASALEGDAQITGDQFLVGPTASLSSPADQVSGSNNPAGNFFGSQINTLLNLTTDVTSGKLIATGSSTLDTRGTFGFTNSNANTGTGVAGARQGYDITSVDISSKISNSQEEIYSQGITTGDVYTINALGLQLQVKAPNIKSIKTVNSATGDVGDTLTFTMTFENIGEIAAVDVVFTDILPSGLTFVPNSLTINGSPDLTADIVAGVDLVDIGIGETVTVVFDAEITSAADFYVNEAQISYTFTPEGNNPPPSEMISSTTNEVFITSPTYVLPDAIDDTGFTQLNTPLNGAIVLTNDLGSSISVSSYDTTGTSGGSIVFLPDGSYTYNPPNEFSGLDTFTYTITDPLGNTDTATVSISVGLVANPDSYSVASNTLLNASTVITNDEGANLSVIPNTGTGSAGGSFQILSDGTFTYTSALNYSGPDTFNYTLTDGSATAIGEVTIDVLPVANNDTGTTPAETPLSGSTVFTNDVGSDLFISSFDSTSTATGTVTMNTSAGTYNYTPPNGFSGIDTFTYTVEDSSGQTATATVTITVLPVANNDTANTTVNTTLNGTDVKVNDIGTNLEVVSLSPTSVQGVTVSMNANGTYTYVPISNFSGFDSFTYTIEDEEGNQDSATVTITIPPVANNDNFQTNANTTLSGEIVLTNDIGSTLQVTSFDSAGTNGGVISSMAANGTFTYVPPTGYSGPDSFQYTVTDSFGQTTQATVFIDVLPVATPDTFETYVNVPLEDLDVLVNDIGSSLDVTLFDATGDQGGSLTINGDDSFDYTPVTNYVGDEIFNYTVEDSSGQTASTTITITLKPIDPPENVQGKLIKTRFLSGSKYCMNLTWEESIAPTVAIYRIYVNGVPVKDVPASELTTRICIAAAKDAQTVEISALDAFGSESELTLIELIP